MKKKILIITQNDYFIYQPTVINLYDSLLPHFDVEIISFQPYHMTKKKDTERNITYLKAGYWPTLLYGKMDFILSRFTKYIRKISPRYTYHYRYYNKYLPDVLRKNLKQYVGKVDVVIAVDLQVLYLAQQLFGSVHFLSLEIDNNTNPLYAKIDTGKIKSVFVQNQLRADYLFPGANLRTFIVQNAPSYDGRTFPVQGRQDIVWAGAIDRRLAIMECLSFIDQYPEYKMVLKGGGNAKTMKLIRAQYKHLLDQQRIVFNQEYLKSDEFIEFLSKFRMGFCFYQWALIKESFNYLTAPSGKLFMYFASGVPVIACNIPGFQLIKDFNAGVLVDDYEPETLLKAAREIEANYEALSAGCYKAAAHFSFDKNAAPYIRFLIEESQQ